MSTKDRIVPFQTQIVSASKIPANPIKCPSCQSTDLVMYGNLAYPARVTYENGKIVDQYIDKNIQDNFEVATIDCLSCQTRTEIQADAETLLYLQVNDLRDKIKEVTGKDPYGEKQ